MHGSSRSVRVFLSSTFRDFGEERDLLVRRVFPALRARLRERFVELVDVDLRWGITVEQAERGEVLPICLAEIDRARPYFVGMLGERYGWIPSADDYAPDLLERQPWLEDHRGGRSVTELEILHGVLNDPAMAGRAFFYFRSSAYACSKGGDYVANSPEDADRQTDLKNRIRHSGFPVVEDYATPEAFAQQLEADMWAILDAAFPADEVPDAFERESRKHEAYAIPRRRLYLGGEAYVSALTGFLDGGVHRVLIEGASGGGKSALIANWIQGYAASHPTAIVYTHYTGASADAADPYALMRRLVGFIKRTTGSGEEIPGDRQKLIESLSLWLGNASAWGAKEGRSFIFVLDALNGLSALRDLRWLPDFLPEHVHLVVSCLPGEVMEALGTKGEWSRLVVEPLNRIEAGDVLRHYLARYNKTLAADLVHRFLAHPLAVNPLFLRTLAEELRLFGVHEKLSSQLDIYLGSETVDDLFERVLERVEGDCGESAVRNAITAIWASRAGLTEAEIMGHAGLVPATWAPVRHALDDALLDISGRLTFGHDYLRIAVSDRYLSGNGKLADDGQSDQALALRLALHECLASWFEANWKATGQSNDGPATRSICAATDSDIDAGADSADKALLVIADVRAAEEIPHQWRAARNWDRLKASLTKRAMFEVLRTERTREELLSYWLDLEREAGADIERDYEAAWKHWAPDESIDETSYLASNLHQFLVFSGRFGDFTLKLARLSLSIIEFVGGPEHPKYGSRLGELAGLLQARGDYADAKPLFRRALAITEATIGENHLETAMALNNLGMALQVMGDYTSAEPLLRRALSIAEAKLGLDGVGIDSFINNLGLNRIHTRDLGEGEALLRRALAASEKAYGSTDWNTGVRLGNLGSLLQDRGDPYAARVLLQRSLEISQASVGPNHPSTEASVSALAHTLEDTGEIAQAETLRRRAVVICEQIHGSEAAETGERLYWLANLLHKRGDLAAAEAAYRRALAINQKMREPEHLKIASCMDGLARLLIYKGAYEEAETLHRNVITTLERKRGSEDPDLGARLHALGLLVQIRGNLSGAELLFRRALAIREKALGPEHPDTVKSIADLRALLRVLGRKPDPYLLISRGDFFLAVLAAKKMARASGVTQLSSLLILAGTLVVMKRDPNWGETISDSIGTATIKFIADLTARAGLDIEEVELVGAEEPMPLSENLRSVVALCMRLPMADFVGKLLSTSD